MTKIASKEPAVVTKRDQQGIEQQVANIRYHEAAGRPWKFTREDEDGPLVCEVTDPAAVEVFLSERNSNTFYALNPKDLKRAEPAVADASTDAAADVEPHTKDTKAAKKGGK